MWSVRKSSRQLDTLPTYPLHVTQYSQRSRAYHPTAPRNKRTNLIERGDEVVRHPVQENQTSRLLCHT